MASFQDDKYVCTLGTESAYNVTDSSPLATKLLAFCFLNNLPQSQYSASVSAAGLACTCGTATCNAHSCDYFSSCTLLAICSACVYDV